jgi:histidinol-phosphate aminotransferase
VPLEDLARIAEAAPDAAVLVDEAYFEFCGESMMPKWRERPNFFVTRTFSKAYGLAGLRIGVLTGHKEQMHMLRRASSPYNLNSVALECLPEALGDQTYIRDYVSQTIEGRCELEAELKTWGMCYWPSRANFVLLHLGDNCQPFVGEMRTRGILVRDRSSDFGCKDCVRITVGAREHNQRLIQALREAFTQLGVRQQVAR